MTDKDLGIKAENRRRPCSVNVRFTREEYGHLCEQAEIVNRRPATIMRGLVMAMRFKPVARLPEEVYRAIRSFGGNLNQLARQANVGRVDPNEVGALREEVIRLLSEIWAKRHG
jgi:hypothetical protein